MRDGFTCPIGGRWAVGFWSTQGPFRPADATDTDNDLHRGKLCSAQAGADRAPRSRDFRHTRTIDGPGAGGIAADLERGAVAGGGRSPWSRRGDGAQSHEEGASQARRPQPDPGRCGSPAAEPHSVSERRLG